MYPPTILLVSQADDDDVDAVEARLIASGARVERLRDDDPITAITLDLSSTSDGGRLWTQRGLEIDLAAVSACWLHRGALRLALPADTPEAERGAREAEWRGVCALLYRLLARRGGLGEWLRPHRDDRLTQLNAARRAGLCIPDTAVASSPQTAAAALGRLGPAVSKALAHGLPGHTHAAAPHAVAVPTLLQGRVPRLADARIFFLDGQCWGGAMFPLDPDTIDWRLRGYASARGVPYRPPPSLQRAIGALMADLALDTGSLDFILTPDGEAVFLEVNPSGRLGGLRCGEDLTVRIAEALLRRARGAPAPPLQLGDDPPPLPEPVIRLHAGCTLLQDEAGRPLLVDRQFGRALEVPWRFLQGLDVGMTRAEVDAAFGPAGLALAARLVEHGLALETRHPEQLPRDASISGSPFPD